MRTTGMQRRGDEQARGRIRKRGWTAGSGFGAAMAAAVMLGGCVQIDTPDRPIEINLNINIRQEVVYRLDRDAKALIQENADIF